MANELLNYNPATGSGSTLGLNETNPASHSEGDTGLGQVANNDQETLAVDPTKRSNAASNLMSTGGLIGSGAAIGFAIGGGPLSPLGLLGAGIGAGAGALVGIGSSIVDWIMEDSAWEDQKAQTDEYNAKQEQWRKEDIARENKTNATNLTLGLQDRQERAKQQNWDNKLKEYSIKYQQQWDFANRLATTMNNNFQTRNSFMNLRRA